MPPGGPPVRASRAESVPQESPEEVKQHEETKVPMQEHEVKAARAQPRYNLGFLREKQKLDRLCALITQALNLSQDSNHDSYHEALALLGENKKRGYNATSSDSA